MATIEATRATGRSLSPRKVSNDWPAKHRLTAPGPLCRRRRVSPEAGRAIEMLGHAIEYLADEFALECRSGATSIGLDKHPQVSAIDLLMARNREIYFSCPLVPTFGERLRALLRL
jgi:hypothetical protein